jgi:hypothetical protein
MAAPEFVPMSPTTSVRAYESPPRRAGQWRADRPGEVVDDGQPRGASMGSPGPDQGYVLGLARRFSGRLTLVDGEHEADAIAGCVPIALKRASLYGRAPLIHDLTAAFTVWGFLDDPPVAELVAARRPLFAEVGHHHHYAERRRLADAVPAAVLRQPHAAIEAQHRTDWRSCLTI